MIKIECIFCRNCFEPKKIKYANGKIPENLDYDQLKDYAIDSGIRFDCPECGKVMYLSDCEFF